MHPTFGRYELLKRLAGGGMGEVYLARQSGIDGFQKLLVVKTLLPHLCEDEEFITMFKDEARVTAQLIHPNICQVFEFEQEGGVKVIDFGVAKAAGRAQHTRTGALKGKYSYMSPEQVAGANVDNRSDIFALGIVLHELLTGRRLFKADSDVQTLARVREAVVAPPSRLNPQLPAGLDQIVLKSLARNPDDRYRTAQEFRLALEDWLI